MYNIQHITKVSSVSFVEVQYNTAIHRYAAIAMLCLFLCNDGML